MKNNLMRDLSIIVISIFLAVILERTGVLKNLIDLCGDFKFLSSFISGIFFVSVFTVVPSSVALVELANASSPWMVALFGGLGALIGDLIIFRFIRDSFSESLLEKLKLKERTWVEKLAQWKIMRMIMPFIGAIIIISPFPDEIGLAIMGFSKVKTYIFIPLAFILNFIGILAMGIIF